ncbi:hypothetical protein HQ520_18565, partial [bacterium]|nr:hypothetical protein [bacterium]
GVYSVAGYDGSSSLIPNGNAHTAITQIKWTSNLQEAELAPSFGHPLSGSQGFNADPDTETVTVNNIGGGTLNISNWELIDENGVFSFTSPGAVSVPGGGSTTVNVTYDPAVGQNPPHLGYLVITSNSFGVSGTTTSLMLVGQPLRQVAKIVDWMPPPGNLTIANANTETPVLTRPWEQAPVGSEERYQGFKWGGNHAGTAATLSLWASGFGGRILFFGSNGTGSSANVPGSYAYTIFDNFGGTTPTKYINLQKITIQNDQTWTGQIIRWLVRDANDNWFLSVGTTNVPLAGPAGAVTVDVDALGGWYAVDATANAEMNELDADADVPIADLGSLTVGSPDLTQVTGAGVYVEFGDEVGVDSARRMFLPDIFTWTKRPDPNETIGLVAGDVSTSNLLVCPNRPIGLVQLIAVFDAGEWEIALDSISCTLTGNGSGAAEIREVLVYTDPNRDGLLGDGELVARGPVSGTTGVATFVDGAFSVTRDSAFDLIYAVLFNDEAIGSTWDVSLQVSDFVLNAAAGGAGDSVVLSGTASAEVTVGSIAIPTGSASFGRTVMAETWDGVATATLPTFDLNVLGSLVGTIPGADNAWDYSLAVVNVVTGGGFRTPSGGTVAAGRETASLTIEPLFYAGVPFTQNLLSPITIGDDTLVGLDFTLYVTGSHASTAVPFTTDGGYGLHPVGTYSDFWLSLNGIYPDESAGGVTLDFFPTTDNDTWAFQVDVDGAEDEQGNLNVWATQKTLAGYGSAGGISTYAVSLQFAPYDENHSIVSMVLTNTATSQADTLVSVMDGRLAEISQVYFNTGGMAANVLIDDIVLTDITVKDQVTNVGTWSIYE